VKIESIPISSLQPDPSNVRKHSEKNIAAIKGSLAKFGQQKPIVVGENDVVIAGNGTLAAAQQLGWEKIDVVRTNLAGVEAVAFAIADNRTGELAEWDEGLGDVLKALDQEMDLGEIGFDEEDLQELIADGPKGGNTDDDEVPEVNEDETYVKTGDLWQLGDHRLLCGDCTDSANVERLMGGEKADMVFTDPPYGVSYEKKSQEIFRLNDRKRTIQNDDKPVEELKIVIQAAFNNIAAVLADKSSYYICSPLGGELGLMMMMMMQEARIKCRHMIIWSKNAPVFSMGRLDYDYKHEPILYGWPEKKSHKFYGMGDMKTSVWEVSQEQNKLHPTMKPVVLIENALMNSTKIGMMAFDPFLGSGSTLIACEKTGRRCFGMEIDPHYCQVIIERWEKYTGNTAKKL